MHRTEGAKVPVQGERWHLLVDILKQKGTGPVWKGKKKPGRVGRGPGWPGGERASVRLECAGTSGVGPWRAWAWWAPGGCQWEQDSGRVCVGFGGFDRDTGSWVSHRGSQCGVGGGRCTAAWGAQTGMPALRFCPPGPFLRTCPGSLRTQSGAEVSPWAQRGGSARSRQPRLALGRFQGTVWARGSRY